MTFEEKKIFISWLEKNKYKYGTIFLPSAFFAGCGSKEEIVILCVAIRTSFRVPVSENFQIKTRSARQYA